MGATITDIGPQVISLPSFQTTGQTSGLYAALSGGLIGNSVDLLNGHNYCNVLVQGYGTQLSGQIQIQIQQSDSDTSGNYTDPTKGMLSGDLTNQFASGCIMTINPNNSGGVFGAFQSGQSFLSGFTAFGAFMRGARYVRANIVSGNTGGCAALSVSFVEQQHVVGSGAGYTYAPGSGSVNV